MSFNGAPTSLPGFLIAETFRFNGAPTSLPGIAIADPVTSPRPGLKSFNGAPTSLPGIALDGEGA